MKFAVTLQDKSHDTHYVTFIDATELAQFVLHYDKDNYDIVTIEQMSDIVEPNWTEFLKLNKSMEFGG